MKKSVLGLMAVVSSFALIACGDDTGSGGSGTTGTTVAASGSTKATTTTGASSGSTKASSGSGNTTASGSSGTGGGQSFSLVLGPGWPHGAGTKHEAAVVIGGQAVQTVTADGGDTVTFAFTDIPEGAAEVHYYADVNGDDGCSAPPADHVWTQTITVDGQNKDFAHDADWTDVCATFP